MVYKTDRTGKVVITKDRKRFKKGDQCVCLYVDEKNHGEEYALYCAERNIMDKVSEDCFEVFVHGNKGKKFIHTNIVAPDLPKEKLIRPAARYDNHSALGIADEFNNMDGSDWFD